MILSDRVFSALFVSLLPTGSWKILSSVTPSVSERISWCLNYYPSSSCSKPVHKSFKILRSWWNLFDKIMSWGAAKKGIAFARPFFDVQFCIWILEVFLLRQFSAQVIPRSARRMFKTRLQGLWNDFELSNKLKDIELGYIRSRCFPE